MVHCIRCQREGEEIRAMPHTGPLGESIQKKICALCWEAWNQEAVRLINEHRLNLREASARTFLSVQMKLFLKLAEPPPDDSMTRTSIEA